LVKEWRFKDCVVYILNDLICYFELNCSEKDEIYLALKNVLFKVRKLY